MNGAAMWFSIKDWGLTGVCYLPAVLCQSSILSAANPCNATVLRRRCKPAHRRVWVAAGILACALPLFTSSAASLGLPEDPAKAITEPHEGEPDLVLLANSTQQTRGETSTVDHSDGLNSVGDAQAFSAEDTRSQESVPIGAAPEDSKDGANFPPAWFALLPVRAILPSFNDLELLIHSWRRPQGTNTYELEFRNEAGDLLLAKFPYENQWHTTDAITRRIGDVPDGEYLIALTADGRRVSNVATVTLAKESDGSTAPPLHIHAIEPLPGRALPALGIQAVGPDPLDLDFTNLEIYSATVFVDGTPHVRGITWVGPVGALGPGEAYALLVDLAELRPEVAPGKHEVFVRVLDYESNHLTLPKSFKKTQMWEQGTAHLEVRPPLPVQVFGQITAPEDKHFSQFKVTLLISEGRQYVEPADIEGRFHFPGIPPGEYGLMSEHGRQRFQQSPMEVRPDKPVEVDIDFRPRYRFTGTVTNSAGEPMNDVHVSAEWAEQGRRFSDVTETDAQGRYTLGAPIVTVTRVHTQYPGYMYEAYARITGESPYTGDLSGRGDIDLVLLTDKEYETRKQEYGEAYVARQQAGYLLGTYAHVDEDGNPRANEPVLTIAVTGDTFSLTYAPVDHLDMTPGAGGLLYESDSDSYRFYFDPEKQRYYLAHTAPNANSVEEFIKTSEPAIVRQ